MNRLFVAILICTALFSSCNGGGAKSKLAAKGGGYEIVVVCDQPKWEGMVGDTLRAVLLEPVPMISRKEPMFDLLRVLPTGYGKLLLEQRNHLIIKTDSKIKTPSMGVEYDVYSLSQIVVTLTAPDNGSMSKFISEKRSELVQLFMDTERGRRVNYIVHHSLKPLTEQVKAKFGFDISIPEGYKLRKEATDFIWISNETHVSQGLIIYSTPYVSTSDLSLDSLITRRTRFVSQIPGPSDGSYMVTSDVMPKFTTLNIAGRQWLRLAGYWDVKNDFMGGPIRNYTTIDEQNRRLITIDFYIYSLLVNQRNLLYDTENIIYTVKLP